MGKWAVAMSGGVDSSVAAALLAAEGHEVVGLTMNLWPDWLPEPDDSFKACCGVSAIDDARAVARQLSVRHYVLNMREEFERKVIDYFVDEYASGRTPNPCIACNQTIKFSMLLEKVSALGLDGVATGHYARLSRDDRSGRHLVLRAVDLSKDQSYVLYGLTQSQLARVRFPVGEYTKEETRSLARRFGLPVANKPDSQEICFVPRGSYTDVIARFRSDAFRPGPIIDRSGRTVGQHQGIARYTIGQRRGIGLTTGDPVYVVEIDRVNNAVIVGNEDDLLCIELVASKMNWIARPELREPLLATARIRHGSRDVDAVVRPSASVDQAIVHFVEPQRAAAPGQAVTLYEGDVVLGGGIITSVRRAASLAASA